MADIATLIPSVEPLEIKDELINLAKKTSAPEMKTRRLVVMIDALTPNS